MTTLADAAGTPDFPRAKEAYVRWFNASSDKEESLRRLRNAVYAKVNAYGGEKLSHDSRLWSGRKEECADSYKFVQGLRQERDDMQDVWKLVSR